MSAIARGIMLSVLAVTRPEVLTLVSVLLGGGFFAAMVGFYKAKPERDSVIVSSAQNAAAILQGLNAALYEELNRTRADLAKTKVELEECKAAKKEQTRL